MFKIGDDGFSDPEYDDGQGWFDDSKFKVGKIKRLRAIHNRTCEGLPSERLCFFVKFLLTLGMRLKI